MLGGRIVLADHEHGPDMTHKTQDRIKDQGACKPRQCPLKCAGRWKSGRIKRMCGREGKRMGRRPTTSKVGIGGLSLRSNSALPPSSHLLWGIVA